MFRNLSEDLRRYGSPLRQLRVLLCEPRVWAVVEYRFARWLHTARLPAILRWPLQIVTRPHKVLVAIATSIELPPQVAIGPGLFIPHAGYIVVGSTTTIGDHCTLTQGVTLGHRAGGQISSYAGPVIGDRVYLGPGAVVLGPIKIGDDVLIGANAVVTESVPDRAVLVGNPARVVSLNGSFELVSYRGMEGDRDRQMSLAARQQPTLQNTRS